MKTKKLLALISLTISFIESNFAQPNWPLIKSATAPSVSIPTEFKTPYKQALSVGGWEDGVFITRDGLNLYCLYTPVDLFSWQFVGGGDLANFSPYKRGPLFGMDLVTNPVSASEWLQSDILISQRANIVNNFPTWTLSNLANPVWSEGAPQINSNTATLTDLYVYASNNVPPLYKTDIILLKGVSLNPSVQGTALPAPINDPNTREDNPHIERLDASNLVLFFDSDDRTGGVGQLDIWYSTSADNGATWTTPVQVSTANTTKGEQQPHLFNDGSAWYLYYTGTNTLTNKAEIYRAKQGTTGNWNSWTNKESVIGAGNSFGVGEATLTQYGDISFVVIYADTVNGTSTDKYDADPWFLPKKGSPLSINNTQNIASLIQIYPNPAQETLHVDLPDNSPKDIIQFYNSVGKIVKEFETTASSDINISDLPQGLYFLKMKTNAQWSKKLIKEYMQIQKANYFEQGISE